jgi:broad specificity phosphatase PhoE
MRLPNCCLPMPVGSANMSAPWLLLAAVGGACALAATSALRVNAASDGGGATFTQNGCRQVQFPASPSGPGYDVRVPGVTTRYVVVMVGQDPAAASFLSRRLSRYLAWLGHKAAVFDEPPSGGSSEEVSPCGAHLEVPTTEFVHGCAADLRHFFAHDGLVAFVRGGFNTRRSRQLAESHFAKIADAVLYLWFDSVETGTLVEPLTEQQAYIRLAAHDHVHLHAVHGYIPSRMASFVMQTWPRRRPLCSFYFSRHGESEYNLEDRLGGDPSLTDKGHADAKALKTFIATLLTSSRGDGEKEDGAAPSSDEEQKPLQIWTSQLARTIETGRPAEVELAVECLRWRNLNEIHTGVCEHMTYADVRLKYPQIDEFRKEDKYAFRYPRGESYQDLVARLEPVILALENIDRPVVVIAHQAILRALLAYFRGHDPQYSVQVSIPHRTVWRCTILEDGETRLETIPLPGASTK